MFALCTFSMMMMMIRSPPTPVWRHPQIGMHPRSRRHCFKHLSSDVWYSKVTQLSNHLHAPLVRKWGSRTLAGLMSGARWAGSCGEGTGQQFCVWTYDLVSEIFVLSRFSSFVIFFYPKIYKFYQEFKLKFVIFASPIKIIWINSKQKWKCVSRLGKLFIIIEKILNSNFII